MRFVDNWILSHTALESPFVFSLLYEGRALRDQWNEKARGITPDRVRKSILNLCHSGHVQVFDTSLQNDRLLTVSETEVAIGLSFDDLQQLQLAIKTTQKGFSEWERITEKDWALHYDLITVGADGGWRQEYVNGYPATYMRDALYCAT